jgi:hypothetical protein
MNLVFLLGLAVLPMLPETKVQPLPEERGRKHAWRAAARLRRANR